MLRLTEQVKMNVGERTVLITTIDERGTRLILLEIVMKKKHWWSLSRPVIEVK